MLFLNSLKILFLFVYLLIEVIGKYKNNFTDMLISYIFMFLLGITILFIYYYTKDKFVLIEGLLYLISGIILINYKLNYEKLKNKEE